MVLQHIARFSESLENRAARVQCSMFSARHSRGDSDDAATWGRTARRITAALQLSRPPISAPARVCGIHICLCIPRPAPAIAVMSWIQRRGMLQPGNKKCQIGASLPGLRSRRISRDSDSESSLKISTPNGRPDGSVGRALDSWF